MYDLILDASNPIPFVMVDSSGVEVAGLGAVFTVTVSKNGGSFGASAGAKAELAGGWYLYTATAGECDTAGPLALKITGAGCAQQNLVYQVKLSALTAQETADAVNNLAPASTGATGSIRKHLDDLLTYGGGSGTGTYTDTITDGTNPLDGVRVQLSTDSAGVNRVYEAFTNASGVFTMNPDPGTYYRWLDLAGYSGTQGSAVVVT